MIKYIIFDMDGVLINSEPIHYEVWKQVFAERGLKIDFEHYKGCIGSTIDTLFNLIQEGYGVDFHGDDELVNHMKEMKNRYIEEHGLPQIEGSAEAIAELSQRGYHLAVASSSPQDYIERNVKKLGIAQYFDALCSAENVARPKPFPDVFLAAAEKIGALPEECLVVEDSYNGSRAAKAAGMKCLGFPNPDSGDQDLSAADGLFYPFSELIEAVEKIK